MVPSNYRDGDPDARQPAGTPRSPTQDWPLVLTGHTAQQFPLESRVA